MRWKKKIRLAFYQFIVISMSLIAVLVGVSMITKQDTADRPSKTYPRITKEVQDYRPVVEKYANEYGVEDYVDVLLAMMMQESGGRGKDPMQASESYCGQIGCIDNPELSIKQGVSYFKQVLTEAEGDLELAIQSYNFGRGFISYVLEESGSYTEEVAIDFSKQMYENAKDPTIYSCLREEAKQYNACYGDIYYVRSVLQYKEGIHLE